MTADADSTETALRWVRAQVGPGRAMLHRAAAFEVVATAGGVAQWVGVAAIAERAVGAGGPVAGAFGPGVLLVFAGGLAAAVLRRAAAGAAQRGADRIADALRERLLDRLLPDGYVLSDEPGSASVDASRGSTAVIENVDDIADYLGRAQPLRLAAPIIMLMLFVVVAVAHWPVAVILLACTALMPLNMRLAGLSARDAGRRQLRQMERLSAVVLESFHAMATLRTLGAVTRRRATIADASTRLNRATTQVLRRAFLSGLIMDTVVTFAIATCATYVGLSLLGYVQLGVAPRLDLFSGLLVLLLCPMYFVPVRRLAAVFHHEDRTVAAAENLATIGIATRDATTPVSPAASAPIRIAAPPAAQAPTVRASGLGYRYPGGSDPMLTGVEFEARPGRWTVITGRSGAGKTTLMSILAGLREPTEGAVTWQDEAGEHPPCLARAGWIGQRTVILDGTLAENIRLAATGATDAELDRAAAIAGVDELLARLPDGLNTRVGDRGVGISAGEARRVAIARTALTGARLWFLDEPTAHLDAATEENVLDALRLATVGCTVIIATHSPTVLRFADERLHLELGVIESPADRR